MKEQAREALEASAHSLIQHYGVRPQLVKSCEEMSELTTKLCKCLNFDFSEMISDELTDGIIDEIADVYIMVAQLRVIFGAEHVETRIITKLERALEAVRMRSNASNKLFEEKGL